jgi:hypothetical protein
VNKITAGQRMDLDTDDFKRTCSYSFDLAEPKLANPSLPREWTVNWLIGFNSSREDHDFELSWTFVSNKRVDDREGVIQFPRAHGFIFGDVTRDPAAIDNTGELELSFLSTAISRYYRVYFEASERDGDFTEDATQLQQQTDQFLNGKHLTYLNKGINKFELINTNIFDQQNLFKLDELGANLIKVRLNFFK